MQALSIFELYVDLISLLKEMEPGIIRFAIQKLKENCYKDLNTDFMDKMRNLRPDIVPEVFTRLWCRTINVNEAKRRGLILN